MTNASRIAVERAIKACTACALRQSCKAPVPFRGFAPADVAWVGEAPGKDEDLKGKPFIGPSGRLLTETWQSFGDLTQPLSIAVLNVVCCRPPDNRDPLLQEVERCQPHLTAQLSLIRPRVVLLLGRIPLTAFLPRSPAITKVRGTFQRATLPGLDSLLVMPVFHPAYVLRNRKTDIERQFTWDLFTFAATALDAKQRDPDRTGGTALPSEPEQRG